jgi:ferredoxin
MGWLGLTFLVGCMLLDQVAGLLPSSAPFIGVVAGVQCSPRVEFRRASWEHRLSQETHENRKEEPMTPSPAPSGPIQVVVDLNRCQAYAQCCFLAKSVFQLHGQEALWYDPAPDASQREQVLRAAAACPVQAITVACAEAANREIAEVPHA